MNRKKTTAIPVINNPVTAKERAFDQRPLALLALGLILLVVDTAGLVPLSVPDSSGAYNSEYIWFSGPEIEEGVYQIPGSARTPMFWSSLYQRLDLAPPPDDIDLPVHFPELTAVRMQNGVYPVISQAPPILGAFFFRPIPINQADRDLLGVLPGIGPKLADRIISFRKKRGKFTGPDELMLVSGISHKKIQRLRGAISFD